MASNLDKIMFW